MASKPHQAHRRTACLDDPVAPVGQAERAGQPAVVLVLAALGLASMWLAVFADVGVMVLAVLNATRALR